MTEKNLDLIRQSKRFGLRVFRFVETLSANPAAKVIGEQLLRSATSAGATSRAACRALSSSEFRSRMAVVKEEADKSAHWLEMLRDTGTISPELIAELLREAGELSASAVTYIEISCRNDN